MEARSPRNSHTQKLCVYVCVSVRNERATIQVENEHFIYLKARIVRRKYYMIKCADYTLCPDERQTKQHAKRFDIWKYFSTAVDGAPVSVC